jgi:lipid-A-disaccharide synthase-like uncharacterized protein
MNTVVQFVSTTDDDPSSVPQTFWFLKEVAAAWDVISLHEAYQSLF